MCKPVQFTERQARALIRSAGDRLKYLLDVRAAGQITGQELDRRINEWRDILRKLEDCIASVSKGS